MLARLLPVSGRTVIALGPRSRRLLLVSEAQMVTQADMDGEVADISAAYETVSVEETQPRLDYPPYRSSILRHPTKSLHHADPETIELYSPAFGHQDVHAL